MADEVRSLSMRASESAKSTNSLIEKTIKAIEEGNYIVSGTVSAFGKNVASAEEVSGYIEKIALASQRQVEGVLQMRSAINEMTKVVQQNAAMAEQTASSSQEMSAQAAEMDFSVEELKKVVSG